MRLLQPIAAFLWQNRSQQTRYWTACLLYPMVSIVFTALSSPDSSTCSAKKSRAAIRRTLTFCEHVLQHRGCTEDVESTSPCACFIIDTECRVDRGQSSEGYWHEKVWCTTSSAARLQLSLAVCAVQGRDGRVCYDGGRIDKQLVCRVLLGDRRMGLGSQAQVWASTVGLHGGK